MGGMDGWGCRVWIWLRDRIWGFEGEAFSCTVIIIILLLNIRFFFFLSSSFSSSLIVVGL